MSFVKTCPQTCLLVFLLPQNGGLIRRRLASVLCGGASATGASLKSVTGAAEGGSGFTRPSGRFRVHRSRNPPPPSPTHPTHMPQDPQNRSLCHRSPFVTKHFVPDLGVYEPIISGGFGDLVPLPIVPREYCFGLKVSLCCIMPILPFCLV